MPVPTRPGGEGKKHAAGGYDRWTFDRWAAPRLERRRVHLRVGALTACVGVTLLCALGWAARRHPATPHASAGSARTAADGRGPLTGVVVILDPGHGGEDPGATLRWGRQTVEEAALTYRTALEIADALRAGGAQVYFTVRSRMLSDGRALAEPTPALPLDAVLATTDRPLRRRVGRSPRQLWQRAALARRVWEDAARTDAHASRDVFFLSLHYDQCRQKSIRGGLVCVDRRAGPPPAFGVALAQGLTAHGWSRSDVLDGQSGLASDGLGVLNPRFNPVPQKALLELATLSNFEDYLRASDPVWRAQVAALVVQSVAEVHGGLLIAGLQGLQVERPAGEVQQHRTARQDVHAQDVR